LQQQVGHQLIAAGADIIIGHHPHVIQGLEIYQGKPIFYSLGNFIFDQYFSSDTQEGLGVGIELANDKITIKLIPFVSEFSQVRFMDEKEKKIFYENFVKWSKIDKNMGDDLKAGVINIIRNYPKY
jgi:poly-gamma-glutamate synthesis protein (capsule biosynthesis protein)